MHQGTLDGSSVVAACRPQHKRLNRPGNVLQIERAKLLEREIEPVTHMIAHRSRDADAARRTFGLKPRRHIHAIAVQIGPVGNRVANVDPDAKADGPIGRLATIVDRAPVAAPSRHSAPLRRCCRTRSAGSRRQSERSCRHAPSIAGSIRSAAQSPQPLERSDIIQPDQAAVADHVGIDHGDQPTVRRRPLA